MSITINDSDFQCLQDQLVDLKAKNYDLAEKNRRSQADFEAAKAKICSLQLKLEEQERDFQVTSTTLRREIEAISSGLTTNNESSSPSKDKDDEDQKVKYKKLLHKAKELQQRYEKSVEIVQQLDSQNKTLADKLRSLEEENAKLKENSDQLNVLEKNFNEKLKTAIDEYKVQVGDQLESQTTELENLQSERIVLKEKIEELTAKIDKFDQEIESQSEERKIQERKGLQIVKELKRQLALEKNRTETLQKRIENLLSEPPAVLDSESDSTANKQPQQGRLSTSSSINGNSSSNGNGSRANPDTNSVGSWSFVPAKAAIKCSNAGLNETISLCSIDSDDRETVQHPCDTTSETSNQRTTTSDTGSNSMKQNFSFSNMGLSILQQQQQQEHSQHSNDTHQSSFLYHSNNSNSGDGMLLEEQAALVERVTKLQHDIWTLEEKLSYMEQANSSLSEDLANKSDIIKHYFMDQAIKSLNTGSSPTSHQDHGSYGRSFSVSSNNNIGYSNSRRTSFPGNTVNQLLTEKPSFKKVVDFLKERSQVSSLSGGDTDSINREATKKMQLMLEETLIKCLKLQENLDFVTNELNKLKS